jgi:CydC: thiol reductant ABC exporter, CydC subunit
VSLEVKALDYEIGGKELLRNISLEIHEKEFVGLIGPNGCGKSTLLKNIYRTLRPKYNTVFINGNDILKLSSRKMARELAVMAQENNMEFDFKVQDMVMFGRYSHKKFLQGDTSRDRELCTKCLAEVGLDGYENRSYLSLSGGEKQRVLLARVLIQESRYIVLDEPTNHLDISYQYQIMDILKKQDATVFSSVHDLNLAALYCDRILFMHRGEIVDHGAPEKVLTSENLWKYFHIKTQISQNPVTGKLQIYYLPVWA